MPEIVPSESFIIVPTCIERLYSLNLDLYFKRLFLKPSLRISVQNGTESNSTYSDGSYIGCKEFSEKGALVKFLLTMKNYL